VFVFLWASKGLFQSYTSLAPARAEYERIRVALKRENAMPMPDGRYPALGEVEQQDV